MAARLFVIIRAMPFFKNKRYNYLLGTKLLSQNVKQIQRVLQADINAHGFQKLCLGRVEF